MLYQVQSQAQIHTVFYKAFRLVIAKHNLSFGWCYNLKIRDVPKNKFKPDLKYEIIYQLDAIEYLFVFFQYDMFRAYTPIFRSNGCYNFFTYAARTPYAAYVKIL